MHNPPHPGEVVRSVLIEDAGMSVTDAAHVLGISRNALSKLINCHTGISPEMAVRLSIALNTSSQMWVNIQSSYDLWQAEQRRKRLLKQVSTIKKFLKRHHSKEKLINIPFKKDGLQGDHKKAS